MSRLFRRAKEETFDIDELIPVGNNKIYKQEETIKHLQKELQRTRQYKRILVRVVESLTQDSQFEDALESYFLSRHRYEIGKDGRLKRKRRG